MPISRLIALIAAVALAPQQSSQPAQSFQPPRLLSGTLPVLQANAVGGGQVFVELSVDRDGRVTGAAPLRTTPGLTDIVVRAVSDWQFAPAEDDVPADNAPNGEKTIRARVDSKVLVAVIVRPPAMHMGTIGEVPRDVGI